jgi:hypothetical protein
MEADANGNGSRQVVRLITGFWITQAIYVAAKTRYRGPAGRGAARDMPNRTCFDAELPVIMKSG